MLNSKIHFQNVMRNSVIWIYPVHLFLMASTEKKRYHGIQGSWCDIDTSVCFQTIFISPLSLLLNFSVLFFVFLLPYSTFFWFSLFLVFSTLLPFSGPSPSSSWFSCRSFSHPPQTSQCPWNISSIFSDPEISPVRPISMILESHRRRNTFLMKLET